MVEKKPLEKKRTVRKRKPRSQTMVAIARRVAKKVVAGEAQVKHTQAEYGSTTSNTPSLISPVSWPGQAITAYTGDESESSSGGRIGNTINLKSFQMWMNLSAGDTTNIVRITWFQWLVPNDHSDETPVFGDIFTEYTGSYPYLSPFNYDNRKKYKILHDKIYTLVTGGSNQTRILKFNFTAKDFAVKKIAFIGDSQTGTSAGVIKGNIYYFISSDSSVLPHPGFITSCRLNFTD
nr:MAG: capsid protein [Cressdnaviricota sp.]